MKKIILSLSLSILLLGCGGPAQTPSASGSPSAAASTAEPGKTVEVSAEGTRFDPAVPVEQMPAGAWACVMKGTVHYASMDQGEGKCPVCKMKLVQQ